MKFVRSAYNYDMDERSLATGLAIDPEEDRAKQEFKEETDINTILRRFNVTGQLPQGIRAPVYADFEAAIDFQTAANAIAEANEAFEAMPAEIRRQFDNDPAEFVAFCSDEKNREKAAAMGLIVPKPVAEEPAPAPVPETPPEGG